MSVYDDNVRKRVNFLIDQIGSLKLYALVSQGLIGPDLEDTRNFIRERIERFRSLDDEGVEALGAELIAVAFRPDALNGSAALVDPFPQWQPTGQKVLANFASALSGVEVADAELVEREGHAETRE